MSKLKSGTRARLMSKPNVHAVWTDPRTGKVNVGVTKKVPLVGLSSDQVIPMEVDDGIRTDVIEMGPIVARGLTEKRRPCPGGFSVGHKSITAGTLGLWVMKDGKPMILSNNHVLANSNEAVVGDTVTQPGPVDLDGLTTDPSNWIGRLHSFVTINSEDGGPMPPGCLDQIPWPGGKSPFNISQPYPNLVDCALAEEWGTGYTPEMHRLNRPSVVRDAVVSEKVTKVGRTTEVTSGWVEAIDLSVQVQYGSFIALFEDQLMIFTDSNPFSQGGDSGSAILSEDQAALVGLLFAGGTMSDGRDVTIANRISHVRSLLDFTL